MRSVRDMRKRPRATRAPHVRTGEVIRLEQLLEKRREKVADAERKLTAARERAERAIPGVPA